MNKSDTEKDYVRWTEIIVLIAIGAFVGANLRYLSAILSPDLIGTFIANVLGCLALGFLTYETDFVDIVTGETRFVVSTGFLSSFTTYSMFALETFQATPVIGVANIVANYGIGFVAVLIGRASANALGKNR